MKQPLISMNIAVNCIYDLRHAGNDLTKCKHLAATMTDACDVSHCQEGKEATVYIMP